jgi:hypothetical protein
MSTLWTDDFESDNPLSASYMDIFFSKISEVFVELPWKRWP